MKELKTARIIYIETWALLAFVAAAFESGILPAGFISVDVQQAYVLHIMCILLGIGGTFSALTLFRYKVVRKQLKAADPSEADFNLAKWNIVRTLDMGTAILFNLVVYYGTMGTTPLYCMLIALAGFVFCWPKTGEV